MKNYFLIELYFLETKNNKKSYFIYGLALPVLTKYKQIIQEFAVESTKIYEKNDSLLLHCYKSIVNIDINKCFSENKINLFLLNKEINLELSYVDSSTSLRNRKDTYLIEDEIESPIESFAKVTSYHTTDIISYIIKNIEFVDLKNILKTLQEKTNQSFYGGYLKKLGCFEVAEVQEWADGAIPFGIGFDKKLSKFYFYKDKEFKKNLKVVFICYSMLPPYEEHFNQLIYIGIDEDIKYFDIIDKDYNYRYTVYDEEGNLLHDNSVNFVPEINFGIYNLSSQDRIKICDNFSKKNEYLEFKTIKGLNSGFSVSRLSELDKFYMNLNCAISNDKTFSKLGCCFKRTKEGVSDFIRYINSIIEKSDTLYFIDPYISLDMLSLALRLDNSSVFITSNKVEPTNLDDKSQNISPIDLARKLEAKIYDLKNNYKSICDTSFYLLNNKFHDRYILIKHKYKNFVSEELYIISCSINSINNINKKNYEDSFIVQKLFADVAHKKMLYIKKLLDKCELLSKHSDSKVIIENEIKKF